MLTLALTLLAAPPVTADSSTNQWPLLTVIAVGTDPAPGPIYLKVAAGDLDGDSVPDEAILKLRCAGGTIEDARYIRSPRDAHSGQASGKRTHKPVKFVKEWGPATPQLREIKASYDVKKAEGGRLAADSDGWWPVTLSGADGLCPAAEAAVKATKTRSNIQNN
jgi:hypothetical protein